jgi:hypothetical protein
MAVDPDVEQAPSGWNILWRRLNPFQSALKLPSIVEVLYGTATFHSSHSDSLNRDLADLLIAPPVGHISVLDFKPFDSIIDVGYRDAPQAIGRATDPRLTRYIRRHPTTAIPEPASPSPGESAQPGHPLRQVRDHPHAPRPALGTAGKIFEQPIQIDRSHPDG